MQFLFIVEFADAVVLVDSSNNGMLNEKLKNKFFLLCKRDHKLWKYHPLENCLFLFTLYNKLVLLSGM